MAGEWREATIGELAWLHDEQVTPTNAPAELFHHFSIPAYDSGQKPAVEPGSAIGSNKYVVPQGEVLVSRLNPRIPRVWAPQIPAKAWAVASTEFLVLRPRDGVDPGFLKYLMLSPTVRSEMEARVTGTSGSHQRVRPSDLLKISVRIPRAPHEQLAIAHILGTLDDKIELNRRMSETLEAMARALFKAWFVDFEPVRAKMEGRWQRGQSLPGLPAHLYDLFPDRLVDSELGAIPEGWRVGRLGDFANVTSGKRPFNIFEKPTPEGKIPLWGGNGPMGYVREPLFTRPILLTGRVGTLGSVFRIPTPCWPSDNTLIVLPARQSALGYFFLAMKAIDFDALNRGSTQPLLTQTDLKNQPLLQAPDRVLEEFHSNVGPLFSKIDMNEEKSRILAALRDALLPKLISGQLRVRDAERFLRERGL
jgi:type I restriction enzyme S subunit